MNQEEFDKRMEEIDTELIKKGIPSQVRPFEAINILYPNSSFSLSPLDKRFFGDFVGANLLDKIQDWYHNRYAKKMLSDFKIGRKPFQLRGEIYYINYPRIYGECRVDVLDCVEDLTENMKCSLTQFEQDQILKEFELGYHAFNAIQSIYHFLKYLHEEAKDLLANGVVDVKTSASNIIDSQNTIFHSHQAAEKFLKALWVELDYHKAVIKKYDRGQNGLLMCGHQILKLYNKLPETKTNKKQIHKQVKYLHDLVPDMGIRYKNQGKTLKEAVQSVNNMLKICNFVSEQIINIHSLQDNNDISSVQEYEEGLLKIYLDKFLSLGVEASQGQYISEDIENAVSECTEHLAIVRSSTEIGNLKQLVGKIKFILSDGQYSQQPKEWSDTLNKVLKLLEVRIAEIEK